MTQYELYLRRAKDFIAGYYVASMDQANPPPIGELRDSFIGLVFWNEEEPDPFEVALAQEAFHKAMFDAANEGLYDGLA